MAGEKTSKVKSFPFLSHENDLPVNLPPFHFSAANWSKREKVQLEFEAIITLELTINCAKDCRDIN